MSENYSASSKGAFLNQFLRDCKQIPHPTPILASPRVQGSFAGYAQALADRSDDPETYLREFYVTSMDGTSMGQAFGLDMLISKGRLANEGPTLGYNTIYFEFFEKGKSECELADLKQSTLFDLIGKK